MDNIINTEQYNILKSIADIYISMHVINLEDMSAYEYSNVDYVAEVLNANDDAQKQISDAMKGTVVYDQLQDAIEFTNLYTIADRIKGKKTIFKDYVGIHIGWFRAQFIVASYDENGRANKVIFTTQNIDEEKRREERLVKLSRTDELTGLNNRHSSEEAIDKYLENGMEDDIAVVVVDINGLKETNDNIGHSAGDELIRGTANCMMMSMGIYGKLYRIGGDEFVAILHAADKIDGLVEIFKKVVSSWSGVEVHNLFVSIGYACAKDHPDKNIVELFKIADKAMYEDKAAFYKQKGIDRRRQ